MQKNETMFRNAKQTAKSQAKSKTKIKDRYNGEEPPKTIFVFGAKANLLLQSPKGFGLVALLFFIPFTKNIKNKKYKNIKNKNIKRVKNKIRG